MAEYMFLIYDDPTVVATASQEDFERIMAAHNRFQQQVVALEGKIVNGNALQPPQVATTIREDVVTDGPFAETKEILGGYYLIEAEDLDKALAIGKLVPVLKGCVEVRPIRVFD